MYMLYGVCGASALVFVTFPIGEQQGSNEAAQLHRLTKAFTTRIHKIWIMNTCTYCPTMLRYMRG